MSAKIKEIKVERTSDGQVILVTVYEAKKKKEPVKVRIRGRQTSDFSLMTQWHRNPSKKPKI
jgi:hypothetical protein